MSTTCHSGGFTGWGMTQKRSGESALFTAGRGWCRPQPGPALATGQEGVYLDQSILLGGGISSQPILVLGDGEDR